MASTKTRTKTIRIANETADYFEDKPLNRMVECVHEMLASGKIGFDGQRFLPEMGVDTTKIEEKSSLEQELKDIEEMVSLCGGTLEGFLKSVDECLTAGTLVVSDGKLVLPSVYTDEFEKACRDKCLDPQSVLDKATKAVERGIL